jgi:methionine-rich copper-binding protein CopC
MRVTMANILMRGLLAAGLVLAAAQAQAHALLQHADPAVGSTGPAPRELVLDYSEGVEVALCTVDVRDAAGVRVDAGDLHGVPGNGKRMAIGLKPLAPGTYRVTWHAVSVDTHRTQGGFDFTVAP